MKPFNKSNALDGSTLHPSVILRYFNQGAVIWLPLARWEKMMKYLKNENKTYAHRGISDNEGITFQKNE